jgi:hypothetical protein
MTLPNVPPSIVRLDVMGGSGPFRVTVQGVPQLKRMVFPVPPAAFVARMAVRRSPEIPEPAPGMPPVLAALSVFTVTVKVAA